MSVSRRADSRWIVKYKDRSSGAWRQKSFRTEAEARSFDADMAYEASGDRVIEVGEALVAYFKNHDFCAQTRKIAVLLVNGPAGFLMNREIVSLTRRDLEQFRENARAKGAGPSSVNRYTALLNAAFNWCAEQDFIPINPWRKYKSLPEKKHPRSGRPEDLAKIVSFLPPWMRWAVSTCMALALRPGIAELFSLTWDAVDFTAGTATVYMPKVDATKTVYVPGAWLDEARPRHEEDADAGFDIVCRNSLDGRVRTTPGYTKPWYKACASAGVRMPFYAIRHITASLMLAGGADLAAVAAQLGHSSITTTAGFYTHALASGQRRAASLVPGVFGAESNQIQA